MTDYNPELTRTYDSFSSKKYSFSKEKKFRSTHKQEFYEAAPGRYEVDTSLNEEKQYLSSHQKALCPKMQQIKVESRKQRQFI